MAKDVGKRVRQIALKSRPPLYQWMHARYDQLLPVLRTPRPSWQAVAMAAFEDGQTKDGQPYSRQTAWKTWKQVQRDRETVPEDKPVRAPAPPPICPPAPPPAKFTPTVPVAEPDLDEEAPIVEPRSRFNLKRPVYRARLPKEET